MTTQIHLLLRKQTGPHNRRPLLREHRDEEILRPDVPHALPPHITLDRHRTVKDRSRIQPRLLDQLTPSRHQRRLTRFDTPTGRLPEPGPVRRITPVQQKQTTSSIQTDDPSSGPVHRIHPRR